MRSRSGARASVTAYEDLPRENFPQFHALEGHDPTTAWSFSLETLVAGLRAQIAGRAAAE